MSLCVAILTLFNRWADDGEKNIRNLMPQPLYVIGIDDVEDSDEIDSSQSCIGNGRV